MCSRNARESARRETFDSTRVAPFATPGRKKLRVPDEKRRRTGRSCARGVASERVRKKRPIREVLHSRRLPCTASSTVIRWWHARTHRHREEVSTWGVRSGRSSSAPTGWTDTRSASSGDDGLMRVSTRLAVSLTRREVDRGASRRAMFLPRFRWNQAARFPSSSPRFTECRSPDSPASVAVH